MELPEFAPGLSARVELTVTDADTATVLGSGDVPVLGTPRLVALAEAATVAALAGRLDGGQTSVGTRVELDHLAATAVGGTVVVRAELSAVDGRSLRFAIPFALVIVAVDVLVASVYAGAKGDAPDLTADNLRVLAGAGLALVIFTVMGVGIGALLRNQVGAIVGALVYLYVVEPIISSIPATAGAFKWLPGGATQAMTASFDGPDILEPWQGGLVLLGYGLVAAVLGTFLAVRRDIA